MTGTAADVLRVAAGEIGYHESGNNITKYGEYFGWNGVAWCDIFDWWVYKHAGVTLPIKTAGVVVSGGYAQAHGLARPSNQCQPGDQICFDWNGGDGAYPSNPANTHVAIVESRSGNTINYIGGNQGSGEVSRGAIAVGSPLIWLTINWQGLFKRGVAPAPKPVSPAAGEGMGVFSHEPTLGAGLPNRGQAVADWRDALATMYRTPIVGTTTKGNGAWDANLTAWTRKFQGSDFGRKLAAQDGIVGPLTWAKMSDVLVSAGHWFVPRVTK